MTAFYVGLILTSACLGLVAVDYLASRGNWFAARLNAAVDRLFPGEMRS